MNANTPDPYGAAAKTGAAQQAPPAVIWWVLWLAIVGFSVGIYVLFGRRPAPPGAGRVMSWIGLGPLAVSMVVRWLVLPRVKIPMQAFVVMIIGLAAAEAATIPASFLGAGLARDLVAVLGLLGVVQWMPIFAAGFASKPNGSAL